MHTACTITTDTVLSNVTLFLPVPADLNGNSPVVAQISGKHVSGVPGDWTVTLYDTGKATLLKVSAPTIGQPAVNGSAQTTAITLVVNASSHTLIDTRSPVENAAVFRPVQGIHTVACPASDTKTGGNPECFEYLTRYLCQLYSRTFGKCKHQRQSGGDKFLDDLYTGVQCI